MQGAADGVVGLGGGVGAADLAEYLLLADHRGVQAAGHREEVLDGRFCVADVGVLGQVVSDMPECSDSTWPITERPPWNASTTA